MKKKILSVPVTENATAISVYIQDDLLQEIAKISRLRETNRPGIIRLAIREYIDRFWNEREATSKDGSHNA